MKKGDYLKLFPEQKEEYKNQVPVLWNKGKTKYDDERIMASSIKTKQFFINYQTKQFLYFIYNSLIKKYYLIKTS